VLPDPDLQVVDELDDASDDHTAGHPDALDSQGTHGLDVPGSLRFMRLVLSKAVCGVRYPLYRYSAFSVPAGIRVANEGDILSVTMTLAQVHSSREVSLSSHVSSQILGVLVSHTRALRNDAIGSDEDVLLTIFDLVGVQDFLGGVG
jgi:hypothetical protein